MDNKNYVAELISKIPVSDVCDRLGITIKNNKALCLFHDDKHPSMHIYENGYKCFSCDANGNIFNLIMKSKDCDFKESLRILEGWYPHLVLNKPTQKRSENISSQNGYSLAHSIYEKMIPSEESGLSLFAENRSFTKNFLIESDVFFAKKEKLVENSNNKKDWQMLLEEKQLIKKLQPKIENQIVFPVYCDYFYRDKVIITLRDIDGKIVGFAGRSVTEDDEPKYLFTKNLPKSDILYGLNKIESNLKDNTKDLDIYIVEGIFDTLRLSSLGLNSIAVLGSSITQNQVEVLEQFLAKNIKKYNGNINIHIFLDTDSAGIQGAFRTIRNLWQKDFLRTSYIDIIVDKSVLCEGASRKSDPDDVVNKNGADWLETNSIDVFEFLIRYNANYKSLAFEEADIKKVTENLSIPNLFSNLSYVKGILPESYWPAIIDIYNTVKNKLSYAFQLSKTFIIEKKLPNQEKITFPKIDNSTSFFKALKFAKNAQVKEELISDEDTWNRMQSAADAFIYYYKNELNNIKNAPPLLTAFNIPKKHDDFRLKTLYTPEILVMQQYILNELLSSDPYNYDYERFIPAVRYDPQKINNIYTTGKYYYKTYEEHTAVSFAYQIDMQALNGIINGNKGIFRPYYECWQSYIEFLNDGIDLIKKPVVYKIKLDIQKYYDNISKSMVMQNLTLSLQDALKTSGNKFQHIYHKARKAEHIIDWIIQYLFHFEYISPETGKPIPSDNSEKGIPQGPSLSAYIGNISLFSVDKAVSEYVNLINSKYKDQEEKEVIYARYVDDMVVIASEPSHLNRVREIISIELGKLNLELSPKTDEAEEMYKTDAYEWLTSDSAGLGVSATFDSNYETTDDILDDASDYEILDRRDALNILKSLTDNLLSIDDSVIKSAIETFFKANEIRYNDIVRFSALLIKYLVRQGYTSDIYSEFFKKWHENKANIGSQSMFGRDGIYFLAFLDGIFNILQLNLYNLQSYKYETNVNYQNAVVDFLATNNIIEMYKEYDSLEIFKKNKYSMELKFLQIFDIAIKAADNNSTNLKNIYKFYQSIASNYGHSLAYRYRISIEANYSKKINDESSNEYSKLESKNYIDTFHLILQQLAMLKAKVQYDSIQALYKTKTLDALSNSFEKVMDIWFKDDVKIDELDEMIIHTALKTLINTVGKSILAEIISTNAILKTSVFEDKDLEYLPVPPGVEFPGIMARNNSSFFSAVFDKNTDVYIAGPLDFESESDDVIDKKKALIPNIDFFSLNSIFESAKSSEKKIQKIVEIYPKIIECVEKNTDRNIIFSKYYMYTFEDNIEIITYDFPENDVKKNITDSVGKNAISIREISAIDSTELKFKKAAFLLRDSIKTYDTIKSINEDERIFDDMLVEIIRRLDSNYSNRHFISRTKKSFEMTNIRFINILDKFLKAEKDGKKTVLLEFYITNNLINEIISSDRYDFFGGDIEYLFSIWAKKYVSRNYEYLQSMNLINIDANYGLFIKRRVSYAYFKLAKILKESLKPNEENLGLSTLISGLFANSILINLRMQVLERITKLSKEKSEKLKKSELCLDSIVISSDDIKFLISKERDHLRELKDISDSLLEGNNDKRIKNITHIGWLVLLCFLTDINSRIDAENVELISDIKKLSKKFTNAKVVDIKDTPIEFPYQYSYKFTNEWTEDDVFKMFELLNRFDEIDKIQIVKKSSPYFKKSQTHISLDGNEINNYKGYFLTSARFEKDALSYEKDGNNYVWTQTIIKETTVGVSTISNKFSQIIFENTEIKSPEPELDSSSKVPTLKESSFKGTEKLSFDKEKTEIFEPIQQSDNSNHDFEETLKHFTEKIQNKNWRQRNKTHLNYDRIALFQFEAESSYDHPITEICYEEHVLSKYGSSIIKLGKDFRSRPSDFTAEFENTYYSCAENRRRKLLEKVFSTCNKFEVEILLLPEYSVRPETVQWIIDEIENNAYKFSVWAGTFRLIPGRSFKLLNKKEYLDKEFDYSSVLPIISNGKPKYVKSDSSSRKFEKNIELIMEKFKKYPSIPLKEFFNPISADTRQFRPAHRNFCNDILFGDARDDVIELICAEVFAIINACGIADFATASCTLNNIFSNLKKMPENYREKSLYDILDFNGYISRNTPFADSANKVYDKFSRTSIILVPACTTRAVDYYILAQNAFLTAGTTMVFCNAKGGSSFIGMDSWDDFKTKSNNLIPDINLYHGIKPGIYQQAFKGENHGALGKNEQALVICDIDPSSLGKTSPNMQTALPALDLVAHIPIIENQMYKKNGKCRCEKIANVLADAKEFKNALQELANYCEKDKKTTIEDDKPNIIAKSLETIGEFSNSELLKLRGEYYRKHHKALPCSWPPSTALDWLWVDVDYATKDENYKIDMPSYTNFKTDEFIKSESCD